VRVDGEILSHKKLLGHIQELKPLAEQIEEELPGMHPSFFEMITAVAFCEFSAEKVDLVVLETGLGGRLDSTNVVHPEISVITTISMDHSHILGDTIEKIAYEKAGIIKKGCPVLTGWLPSIANETVRKVALNKKAPFHTLGTSSEDGELPRTNLIGLHQRRNAALAVKVTEMLAGKFPLDPKKSSQALFQVELQGRWQVIQEEPMIILDACHNQEGAQALVWQLDNLPSNKELIVWFGALGQDRAQEILPELANFANEIRLFQPNQPRASSFDEMEAILSPIFEGKVQSGESSCVPSYFDELKLNQILLITGSIYLLGEVLESVKKSQKRFGSSFQDLL
jgi:dihydrofolate synthase/folylpolyglutamate synthase